MKKKKLISLLLAAVMTVAMVTPVYADEDKASEEESTTIEITEESESQQTTSTAIYQRGESYVVTIPAQIEVGLEEITEATISASEVCLNEGNMLCVKISSANKWNLVLESDTNETKESHAYAMRKKGETFTFSSTIATAILTVRAGVGQGETVLEAGLTGTPTFTKTGDFTDTLTFAVSVIKL